MLGPELCPDPSPDPAHDTCPRFEAWLFSLLAPAVPAQSPLGVDGLLSSLGQDPRRLHQALKARTRGPVLPETNEKGRRNPRQPTGNIGQNLLKCQLYFAATGGIGIRPRRSSFSSSWRPAS